MSVENRLPGDSWCCANYRQFEENLNGAAASPMHRVRAEAFAKFVQLGFPSTKVEEWKYTNLAELAQTRFSPFFVFGAAQLSKKDLKGYALEDCAAELVFVDGRFAAHLSSIEGLPNGVMLGPLAELLAESAGGTTSWVNDYLAKYARCESAADSLIALNTAFLHHGSCLLVPEGLRVEKPIHLLYMMSNCQQNVATYLRNLIVVKPSAEVCVVERYVGLKENLNLTSVVTEVSAQENAVVEHYRIQQESLDSYHLSSVHLHQERGSNYSSRVFNFGGALVRNDVSVKIHGDGCTTLLGGVSAGYRSQHIDNQTLLDHIEPHCQSSQVFKGVYGDQARGVFNGTIIVRPEAQKTNAFQMNNNLLLSDEAQVESKPQLKIWADDVKCTHGATVGQLDEEGLFYLCSRGISRQVAKKMLIQAFAGDVLHLIKNEPLRNSLEHLVTEKLGVMVGVSLVE